MKKVLFSLVLALCLLSLAWSVICIHSYHIVECDELFIFIALFVLSVAGAMLSAYLLKVEIS